MHCICCKIDTTASLTRSLVIVVAFPHYCVARLDITMWRNGAVYLNPAFLSLVLQTEVTMSDDVIEGEEGDSPVVSERVQVM